jgi:hypothetical protein
MQLFVWVGLWMWRHTNTMRSRTGRIDYRRPGVASNFADIVQSFFVDFGYESLG